MIELTDIIYKNDTKSAGDTFFLHANTNKDNYLPFFQTRVIKIITQPIDL